MLLYELGVVDLLNPFNNKQFILLVTDSIAINLIYSLTKVEVKLVEPKDYVDVICVIN